MNVVGMCWNIFLPWLLFCFVYYLMSFHVHYDYPHLAWASVWFGFCMSAIASILGCISLNKDRAPSWYFFLSISFFLATLSATVAGDLNFWLHFEKSWELDHLNTYPAVDPATETGEQVMDAGRVYFAHGVKLNRGWSQGFKHGRMYCVAPIVNSKQGKRGTYDFWAVGIDCCDGETMEFRCGDYNNPYARSGRRQLNQEDRFYYRLAVQQAEAAYGIRARHPVFFHWVQDPVNQVIHLYANCWSYYLMGVGAYFIFNFFCVLWATFLFAKLGNESRHGDY